MANLYNENALNTSANSAQNTLSAFFDSRSDAERAVERLKGAGISAGSIRFMPGHESDVNSTAVSSDDRSGFWAKLEDWFFPDEDRATYAEGLRRGGFLVSVTNVSDALYETAHDILDDEGSIDIDQRADQWRAEGWQADASNRTLAASTSAAQDRDLDRIRATDRHAADLTDETIPVVEENLRVGKRDVNNGSVRVRAHIIEHPVHEDVSLRDESVSIERRAVDRPLTDADNAFRDRTINAEEHHEEAVVSKDARVVEEVGLRKTASTRTETINDSVRKTEVEVDDERSAARSSTGLNSNSDFKRN